MTSTIGDDPLKPASSGSAAKAGGTRSGVRLF